MVETAQILPEPLKGILATDPADFFSAKNKIDDKYVVLVFDDLERCQMNSVDVLGIINDYCENGQYHTIIVANQEKIVQRTVQYIPDYKKIVHTVITSMKYENSEYKAFIESCESGSIALRHIPSRIKLLRIMDIDDSVLQDGFSDFLVMAYSGNLTLEEYVRLVENSCWARKYQCPLPESSSFLLCKTKPQGLASWSVFGGDKRDRTADLLNAIQALSQLSYTPYLNFST